MKKFIMIPPYSMEVSAKRVIMKPIIDNWYEEAEIVVGDRRIAIT